MKALQNVFAICLLFLAGSQILAQQGNVAAGGDASGAGGSMSYSIGQTDYLFFASPAGSLQFGLQQIFFFEDPAVPATRNLTTNDLNQGEDQCFDATETIVLAGSGTAFIVEDGTGVDLVAGNNILMLPGTHVQQGGYLYARIAESADDFCNLPKSMLATSEALQKPDQHPDNGAKNGAEDIILPTPENDAEPLVKIYPNPTTGHFTLELLNTDQNTEANVWIYGMQGGLIHHDTFATQYTTSFDLSGRQAGVYYVRVMTSGRVETVKLLLTPR